MCICIFICKYKYNNSYTFIFICLYLYIYSFIDLANEIIICICIQKQILIFLTLNMKVNIKISNYYLKSNHRQVPPEIARVSSLDYDFKITATTPNISTGHRTMFGKNRAMSYKSCFITDRFVRREF